MAQRFRTIASFSMLSVLVACSSADSESSSDPTPDDAGGTTLAGAGTNAAGGVAARGGTMGGGDRPAAGHGAGSASGQGGTQVDAGGADAAGSGTGASAGTGTGGTTGSAGAGGSAGSAAAGGISINDAVPGFASVSGGTTGGGKDLSSALTVSSMSALQNAAKGGNAAVILVEPGNYSGTLTLGSNKTIIGKSAGVTITGNIGISGNDVSNVIIRNIAVRGNKCSSYEECKSGDDAVYIGGGAHHVWLDHLDIADGQDGNCDVTQGGDFVTVSWTHFHYTYAKEHRFSNLIAGSDDETNSVGKLHITYMNSYWGELVDARQPRGRFGNVHLLNNYHKTGGSQIHGVGKDMALIAENNFYDEKLSIWTDMGSPRGWKGIGNEGTASNMNATMGTVFDIPYAYTALPASQVVKAVTAAACGAGNTCMLAN
jgi:pectate lyase